MPRRILILGLLAVLSQVGSGCCHLRERIAYRWHYFHPHCHGCAPAFKVPASAPVAAGPGYSSPAAFGAPAAGCPSCYTPDAPAATFAGPVGYPVSAGPISAPPGVQISGPMPLLQNPSVDQPLHAPSVVPNPMPNPKAPAN